MQVIIDGVPYAPACAISSRIGIAITTHQRADVLKRTLEQHMKHLPACALVVVIDDGSKPQAIVPDGVTLLRHEQSRGIVASNNSSLTALVDHADGETVERHPDSAPRTERRRAWRLA